MSLVEYAKAELQRAGLFDKDSDYDGMLGTAVLDIIKVFAKQGHSGFSAEITTQLANKLMRYEPITPLTYEPDEWTEVADKVWQNKRDPKVFSYDGGLTHTRLGDAVQHTEEQE